MQLPWLDIEATDEDLVEISILRAPNFIAAYARLRRDGALSAVRRVLTTNRDDRVTYDQLDEAGVAALLDEVGSLAMRPRVMVNRFKHPEQALKILTGLPAESHLARHLEPLSVLDRII